MTKQEFTERTGMTVSAEEYSGIEAIYMAAGDMDKDEFCREYKKCGKSTLPAELAAQIKRLERRIADLRSRNSSMLDIIIAIASEECDQDLYEKAVKLAGQKEVTLRTVRGGYEHTDDIPVPLYNEKHRKINVFRCLIFSYVRIKS